MTRDNFSTSHVAHAAFADTVRNLLSSEKMIESMLKQAEEKSEDDKQDDQSSVNK